MLDDKTGAADEAAQEETAVSEETEAWQEFEAADDPKAAERAISEARQDAGFDERKEDEPEGGDDQTADGEKSAPEPDIWANATPEQKAALEAARAEGEKAKTFEHEIKSNRGRIAALQRQVEDLKKGKQPDAQTASDKPSGLTSEKWKKLKEEYPDLAEPFEEILGAQRQEIDALKGELSGISSERKEKNLADQAQIVTNAHEDYDDIAQSDAFHSWYLRAPAYVKAGVERNAQAIVDGAEVKHIVQMFKDDATSGYKPKTSPAKTSADKQPAGNSQNKNPPAPDDRRSRQLESARSPRTRTPGASPSGIPEDAEGAWRAFERLGL